MILLWNRWKGKIQSKNAYSPKLDNSVPVPIKYCCGYGIITPKDYKKEQNRRLQNDFTAAAFCFPHSIGHHNDVKLTFYSIIDGSSHTG